jgi:glyoxylase-like metal-dependent hydrolase (beta-lactamase superfamily II)
MQGSTVVINPPDGDMSTYLSSLRRLSEESIDYLAPGHGFLMGNPQEAIERVLLHRQDRENKILSALRQSGGSSGIDALVAIAYQDVPVQRHALATRSLLAHLYKLKQENRVLDLEGQWQLAAAV